MRNEQKKNILKNKQLNQNSSNIDIEEVNKAIELTRFNVSIYHFLISLIYRKSMLKMLLI
jgi:hypothetical protein